MTNRRNDLNALLSSKREPTKEEAVEALAYAVPAMLGNVVFLTKMVRAARRGNYDKATFYAVLWAGWSNNTSRAFNQRFGNKFGGR